MSALDDMELVGNIAVKGPPAYREQIKSLLTRSIRLRVVGQAVLDAAPQHKIVIMPDPKAEKCNGSVPIHPGPSNQCKSITTVAPIEFSPGCTDPKWPDDDVLVHELLHAVRKALSRRDCGKLPKGLQRFDNREEFFAILVANIYTSEKHNKPLADLAPLLRRDHRDGRMNAAMAKSFLMDDGILALVEAFMLDMEALAEKIARVRTAFNPIRDVHQYALACVAGA